jgi:hypothetical protein
MGEVLTWFFVAMLLVLGVVILPVTALADLVRGVFCSVVERG